MPYIGHQSTANSKIKKYSFTATASQTAFSVASNAGDELQVFLNGVLLKETDDYTYTTSTVTLGTGATVSDIVEVHVYQSFSIAETVDIAGDIMTGELTVPTVKLSSNVIKASDGGSTLTLDTSDNLTVAGNIQVGGNIIKASDGGSTITLDTSDNVTIAGNLKTDTIAEKTSATGVTVDGVLLKDSEVSSGAIGSSVTMSANQACVKTALNASGSAPIFTVRAWANFNQATLNANGNIAGVVDNGTGNYTVSFTTNMSDVNYSAVLTAETSGGYNVSTHTKAVGSFIVSSTYENSGAYDSPISLVVVR